MSSQSSAGVRSLADEYREAERQSRGLASEAYARVAALRAAGETPVPQVQLGKCTAKGCKFGMRRELAREFYVHHHGLAVRVVARIVPSAVYEAPKCPEHGRYLRFANLEARRTEKACDVRCTGARGHKCECSCGGENHGADLGGAR